MKYAYQAARLSLPWVLLAALLGSCWSPPASDNSHEGAAHEMSGLPWKMRDRATGIEMVLVMPGVFLLGSPETEQGRNANEGPQHRVRLTRAFYPGATEVTQGQWKRSMGRVSAFFKGDSKPVDASWVGTQEFLVTANGRQPGRHGNTASNDRDGVGVSVPSEDDRTIRIRGAHRA